MRPCCDLATSVGSTDGVVDSISLIVFVPTRCVAQVRCTPASEGGGRVRGFAPAIEMLASVLAATGTDAQSCDL